jgi:F-box and WD-40 domain protein 1/11
MRLNENWTHGVPEKRTILCNGNGIYCLQYDWQKIVTGSRDNAIKIWDMRTHDGVRELRGHDGSVLCLQFDDKKVISGSSDATVRVWDLATGNCMQILDQHTQSVLHLRVLGDTLVTCSKDKTVMIWKSDPRTGLYDLVNVLREHRAAVNVVEFDEKYVNWHQF